MMADFEEDGAAPAVARERSMSARVSPAPKAPIWRKPRRLMPSQNRRADPRISSMVSPSLAGKDRQPRDGADLSCDAGLPNWPAGGGCSHRMSNVTFAVEEVKNCSAA